MGCSLAPKCAQRVGNLVVDCHKATSGPPGMLVRSNQCAKRSYRCSVMKATCSVALQQPMADIQHALTRPLQMLPRQVPTALVETSRTEVLVHLSVNYKCDFGTRLALIGSQQGWQTSAATPMAWSPGDVWTADMRLPVGADVEYKYIVVDGSGTVIRWQEGYNNRLSVKTAGLELHVADSWAQDRRQVHEVPAAAARVSNPSSSSSDHEHQQAQRQPAAAEPVSHYSKMDSVQNNITRFSRPAGLKSTKRTSADYTAPSISSKQQLPASKQLNSALDSSMQSQTTLRKQQQRLQQQQHQQQELRPQRLVSSLEKLLPLLQDELASALDALSSVSSAQDPATVGLLAEGQAVLGLLKQQTASAASSSVAVAQPAQSAGIMQQKTASVVQDAAVSSRANYQHPESSSSSRSKSHGSRSPGSSPGSSLASASEDEIAAALLSDDCEEACYCLVDAICNCMASGGSSEECSEVHYSQHDACNPVAFAAEAADASYTSRDNSPAFSSMADSTAAVSTPTVDELVTAEQLVSHVSVAAPPAMPTTAAGSERRESDAHARAAAFAGVQKALDQSAELLDYLADPSHPMMIEADRQVAVAKRQLGQLLPA